MTTSLRFLKRQHIRNLFSGAVSRVISYFRELFSLEEVEVTFTKVGDSTRYSYTKVEHKHAA